MEYSVLCSQFWPILPINFPYMPQNQIIRVYRNLRLRSTIKWGRSLKGGMMTMFASVSDSLHNLTTILFAIDKLHQWQNLKLQYWGVAPLTQPNATWPLVRWSTIRINCICSPAERLHNGRCRNMTRSSIVFRQSSSATCTATTIWVYPVCCLLWHWMVERKHSPSTPLLMP